MKKQLFRYLSGIIPAVAMFSNLHAQSDKPSYESNVEEYTASISGTGHARMNEENTAQISNRALKDFSKSFKDAVNPDWQKIKYGFLAKFEKSGTRTRVFYDASGRWSSTIYSYGKEKLPKDVLNQVRSVYYDYEIYLVNEIKIGDDTVYLVSVHDEKTYKTIRVTAETMDVYEDFEKM